MKYADRPRHFAWAPLAHTACNIDPRRTAGGFNHIRTTAFADETTCKRCWSVLSTYEEIFGKLPRKEQP